MNTRMVREYEIRGVAERDLADVPQAKSVRGLIDSRLAAARGVAA